MNFFNKAIVLSAIASTSLLSIIGCTKENVHPVRIGSAQNLTLKSDNNKEYYAKQIAEVFFLLHQKKIITSTLTFKGRVNNCLIDKIKLTEKRHKATFSLTTLTSPQLIGTGWGVSSGHIGQSSISGTRKAMLDYFLKVAQLEFVSIYWLQDLLNHLNRLEDDLNFQKRFNILVSKQDYANEITRLLYNDLYAKGYHIPVLFFDGAYHQCIDQLTARPYQTFSSRSRMSFSFTTLTNPQIIGQSGDCISDKNATEQAIQDYFNKYAALSITSIGQMKSLLLLFNELKNNEFQIQRLSI